MKKFMCLINILAAASFVLLNSCSTSVPKETTSVVDSIPSHDLPEILKQKELVALTEFSSYNYFIYKGVPMGFEYELLSRFAEEMGLSLKMVVVNEMDSILEKLNNQEGDIIAAHLTVTRDRQNAVDFTYPVFETKQVLVQRLPDEHWKLSRKELNRQLIQKPSDLIGKTIHTRKESSFYPRIRNLMEEIGDSITISFVGELGTEALIQKVAEGEFDYTVMDENIAKLNKTYYPNIDISLPLSLSQRVAWAVRKDSPQLKDTLDQWLKTFTKSQEFAVIYLKYFKARTQHKQKVLSEYSSLFSDKISPYDAIIKEESKRLNWDWKLLAAIIYQESKFIPDAESWTGAGGLMQLIPETAERFGADSIADPTQNIKAGVSFLKSLEEYWSQEIPDENERIPYVLASYNVGLGHMLDALRLTEKYGGDIHIWDDVAFYLEAKSQPQYYKDEVVRHGYCRGREPVNYVKSITSLWQHYQNTEESVDLSEK